MSTVVQSKAFFMICSATKNYRRDEEGEELSVSKDGVSNKQQQTATNSNKQQQTATNSINNKQHQSKQNTQVIESTVITLTWTKL